MSDAAPAGNAVPAATPATPASAEPIIPGKIATMTPEDYRQTLLGSHGKEAAKEAAEGKQKEQAAQKVAEGDAQKAKAEATPSTEDFTTVQLPPNARIDKFALDEVVAFARANGLSAKAAQALLERENQSRVTRESELEAWRPGGIEWTKQVDAWEAEARKRPSLGKTPEEFNQSLRYANDALVRWFPPGLLTFLRETGYASNPDVVEGLAKLGRAQASDVMVRGSVAPPPKADKPRTLEDMYSRKAEAV